MSKKRVGKQTLRLQNPPCIAYSASVGGKMEADGPLAGSFDFLSADSYFGAKSWESAESAMLKKCFDLVLDKAGLTAEDIQFIFTGDLLNQCVGSEYAVRESGVPLFGLFGACATMSESLALAAMTLDGGFAETVCAMTASHYCSAERQFRLPLAYGGQRTPTAQWTATAAGALIITNAGEGPYITHVTPGKIVDAGIRDAANMGSAMAPAALETICAHLADTGRAPDYYDRIVTGDLGLVGHRILLELALGQGYDLGPVSADCGMLLFDRETQDVHAGGSGCGCSASVLVGHFLPKLKNGELKRLLFCATGALMSPTTAMQGESVLGICHAVAIENTKDPV
ncbi:MAG: stage V sporulation protein AD [Oscillospiraceae bacterium]|jgi:stage V sporulation protein AD|nr:stage V sporulation protein AD [Oscillospiraceae bacterium]